jgi:hypothetical protein
MAKPRKSQNPEFLEKRRSAIAELAKRRRQGRLLTTRAAVRRPGRRQSLAP